MRGAQARANHHLGGSGGIFPNLEFRLGESASEAIHSSFEYKENEGHSPPILHDAATKPQASYPPAKGYL